MNKLQLRDKIREALWESLEGATYDLGDLREELTDDSDLDEAGIDSLDLVELNLRLEDLFEIEIAPDSGDAPRSVTALTDFIWDRIGQAADKEGT